MKRYYIDGEEIHKVVLKKVHKNTSPKVEFDEWLNNLVEDNVIEIREIKELVKSKMRFLVQRVDRSTDERFNSIMDVDMLVHYIDMQDCCDEEYEIFDISNLGSVNRVFYAGWKPNCLIEIVDIYGNVIASGYGTDH